MGRGHRKKIGNKRYSPYEEKRPSTEIDGEDSEDSSVGFYGPTQSLLPTIPIPRHLMSSTSNPMEEGMMSTNSRQDPLLISEGNVDSWDMTVEQSAFSKITMQPKDLTQSTSNSSQESRITQALQTIPNVNIDSADCYFEPHGIQTNSIPPHVMSKRTKDLEDGVCNTDRQALRTISNEVNQGDRSLRKLPVVHSPIPGLVRELSKVVENQTMILNKLAAIETKMDNEENSQPTRSDPDKITVIDTVDDLVKFEVSLQEPDNYYAVVNHVRMLVAGPFPIA
ncbi:hypothetical protein GHT06_020154 [Daphnia sinensis]|uniref:Uncharacterized protein n=1 Tax=Daphnia sinensis TaxID=1820382 RepID=A0AAD5KL32_9CRUS|nr:hypothetical protein GHT06_020154 [Daphnia sinensis]